MIPKSIEDIQSVYQLGYFTSQMYGGELKPCLIAAIESVITKATDKKQKELLGDTAYMEYLCYKKEIEENKFNFFIDILDYLFPKKFDIDNNEKSNLVKAMIESKALTKEALIAANLAKNYFSINEFESFIKQVDEVRRQIN